MAFSAIIPAFRNRCGNLKNNFFQIFAGESRRQLLISISALAGSGMISLSLRFVGSIIQGRFVGPEILGYYVKFTILPGYLFFLHMGVFTSLARQYPYYIGKGARDTALNYAANALGWTYLLCAIHAVVFFIPCAWAASRGDWFAALGWGVQIILTNTSLYMFYLGCTYRNSSEFVAWSKAQVISAVFSLLFLPLVAFYHFVGICARYSLPNLISMLYAHLKRPLKIRSRFSRVILMKMMAFGMPLMVFAYISTSLWVAIERTYILKMTGETTLGVFFFAGTLCAGLIAVSTSISQVFNPRLAMLYGSSGNNMATCFRYCIKCAIVGLGVMLPLVAAAYWLVDPMVRWLLPKYVESIPIARYIFWLSLIPVIDLPKQLLMVAKRTRQIGIAVVVSFVSFLMLLAIFTFFDMNVSLKEIVIASVACKLLSVFICNIFAWRGAVSELRVLCPSGHGGYDE
jgi:O-antigen/teichoic acid export membrane protein